MTPRAFLEVTVLVPGGWHELVAEALTVEGCTGVAFGPRSLAQAAPPDGSELVRAFFPKSIDAAGLRSALSGRLVELGRSVGAAELRDLELDFRDIPLEDWATTWRKVWRPQRVGNLCVVSLDWDKPTRPTDVIMRLEPGAAFGTGRHATTRTALGALQDRLKPGERVLDAGCGSGILAVAAVLLGAGRAVGFDFDQNAVDHADELAAQNGVEARTEFFSADLEALPAQLSAQLSARGAGPSSGPAREAPVREASAREAFDGLLANLYGDLVRAHAPELAARIVPGGWFVITGCRRDHRGPVLAALEAAGLRIEQTRNRGRWDAHVGIRPT